MSIFGRSLVVALLIFVVHNQYNAHAWLCEGFLEKNDLVRPIPKSSEMKMLGGVNEAQFNQSIDKVSQIYNSIFLNRGMRLQVKKCGRKTK